VAWSGKLLGGVLGGMVGGPVGAGVGAALGHILADGGGATGARSDRPLVLGQLRWRHHGFSADGPGVHLAPTWRAVGHRDLDVHVTLRAAGLRHEGVLVPERDDETVALPTLFVPYARLPDAVDRAEVRVLLASRRGEDAAAYDVDLPSPVRRLGSSGPARVVMALVACARAENRRLTREDIRFVRETFEAAWPLSDAGTAWLRRWLHTLAEAGVARLAPDKVAARLRPHLPRGDATEVLLWMARGTQGVWPGEATESWLDDFAAEMGVPDMTPLWEEVEAASDAGERSRALETLGLPPGATLEEARRAWRDLVRTHHPDLARTPEESDAATARTAALNAAWAVLRGADSP
jgi:DnaJ like chaperone protein